MQFPNKKQFARFEEKGFGNFGTYYLDKGISERVRRLIGVKVFDSGTIHDEHSIKHRTHQIIQTAQKKGTLPSWITSIDVVGSEEKAQKRGAIYQEHAEGKTLYELMENKSSDFFSFINFFIDFLSLKLLDIGIKVIDFHEKNIVVDEIFTEDFINFFKDEPDGDFETFQSKGKIFVNIDVGNWSILPQTQTPLSSLE